MSSDSDGGANYTFIYIIIRPFSPAGAFADFLQHPCWWMQNCMEESSRHVVRTVKCERTAYKPSIIARFRVLGLGTLITPQGNLGVVPQAGRTHLRGYRRENTYCIVWERATVRLEKGRKFLTHYCSARVTPRPCTSYDEGGVFDVPIQYSRCAAKSISDCLRAPRDGRSLPIRCCSYIMAKTPPRSRSVWFHENCATSNR